MIEELTQLSKLVVLGMALMLPLANPLTSMSLLLSLGGHIPYAERQRQIKMGAIYVVAIILVTYYAGTWIMHTFGISIPGMRIAGGLIVGFLGFTMLFPPNSGDDADATVKAADRDHSPNIAFVPLALPGTAGPGTIAMIISMASKARTTELEYAHWVVMAAPPIIAVLLGVLFWVCLRFSAQVVKLIGHGGVEAISRVMGFLLVCMGVQFVIGGVLEIVEQYSHQVAG